jgi:hypothetical protein
MYLISKFHSKVSAGNYHEHANCFSVVPIDSSSAHTARRSGEPMVIKTGRHAIISVIKQVFKSIVIVVITT